MRFVARALAFTGSADFYNDHISRFGMRTVILVEEGPDEHLRNNVSFKLMKSRVDFAVIQLFTALADASSLSALVGAPSKRWLPATLIFATRSCATRHWPHR